MRILFLTDYFHPEVSPPASRIHETAAYLAKWGHEVCVLTSSPNYPDGKIFPGYKNKWLQTETIDGIRVIRVKTFMTTSNSFMLRILDFLSYMVMATIVGAWSKKPDVIIATSPHIFTAVAGWSISAIKRRPFVFEIRDLWAESVKGVVKNPNYLFITLLEKLEIFLYRRAKRIIALTQAFKIDLINRKIPTEKIFVVKNGVNTDFFQPQAKDENLIASLSIANHFVVGYIGTFGMAQGLENVLFAAKLLKNMPITILFVGSGVEKDKLQQIAKDLMLNNVQFISLQPKSEIKKYWSLCDCALVHLKNEPVFQTVIPSKIFDAMAMEIPIIFVGPTGEASTMIENTGIGICVAPDQPELLAQALLDLSQNKSQLEQYKAACKKSVTQFTRENQAKETLEVLNQFRE